MPDIADQLDLYFDYHQPDKATAQTHEAANLLMKGTAMAVKAILPNPSDERTLVIRHLLYARYHLNAAISFGEAADAGNIAVSLDEAVNRL